MILHLGSKWRWLGRAACAGVILVAGCSRDEGYNGRSAREIATMLASADSNERIWAADAFRHSPPSADANVRALLLAANDSVQSVRERARQAIGQLHSNASDALVEALTDTSVVVRRRAAEFIGQTRDESRDAVRPLVRRLSDSDDSVRTLALLALGALGPLAYEARDTIRSLAETPGPQRAAALIALPRVDSETHSFISLYTSAFADTSAIVRTTVIRHVLAGAREPHHDVLDLLGRALGDESDSVRIAALEMLRFLGPRAESALAGVQALRQTGSARVRAAADSAADAIRGSRSRSNPPR